MSSISTEAAFKDVHAPADAVPVSRVEIDLALFTGCQDKPYVYGLGMELSSHGICLDLIGSDEVDSPDFHRTPKLNFLNMGGKQRQSDGFAKKSFRVIRYYSRLVRYSIVAKPKIFHILWNYKFEYFDRTLLMLYYKLLGKMIVLTAHNVNQAKRDLNDSLLNRLTLRMQYRIVDHIFVHTEQMKSELVHDFGVRGRAVTVIPFGINNAVPNTNLTSADAKRRLGVGVDERTILCFGRIRPYKGIEHLLAAFKVLLASRGKYRLIIAGEPKKGSESYFDEIRRTINREFSREQIILKMQFIPDEEMELYLKAADVLVLPYKDIFQSGVLFLAYGFGLPVVATDVGPFREEIVEGNTGFLCRPGDPADLTRAIETYFESDLFKNLSSRRQQIRDYANGRHSWNVVGELTRNVYAELLQRDRP
jgi:glycosyltransferase involved in cell wall biosynthesis